MGSGRGRSRRVLAAGANSVNVKPKNHRVPGDHPLIERYKALGGASFTSKEISENGSNIAYLTHSLYIPQTPNGWVRNEGRQRTGVDFSMEDSPLGGESVSMLTPADGNNFHSVDKEAFISACTKVIRVAQEGDENSSSCVMMRADTFQANKDFYITLMYSPPKGRREKPKIIMGTARQSQGVISTYWKTPTEKASSHSGSSRFAEFYLEDLDNALTLLQREFPLAEQEFAELQEKRKQKHKSELDPARVADLQTVNF